VVARTGEEGALAAPPPSGAAIFLSVKPAIAALRLEPWPRTARHTEARGYGSALRKRNVMSVAQTLWASIQEDPVFMRKINGWLTVFWLLNFPPVIAVYIWAPDAWKQASILYLALVSIYANVAGHLAAWQASRIEVIQNDDANVADVLEKVEEIHAVTTTGASNG